MKNLLLLTSVAMIATAASAQVLNVRPDTKMIPATMEFSQALVCQKPENNFMKAPQAQATLRAKAPRRTAATGVYYQLPKNAMYMNFDPETGMGTYPTVVLLTPYTGVTLTNACSDPEAALWFIGERDITEYADENNDFSDFDVQAGGALYFPPTITVGRVSYTLAENTNAMWLNGSFPEQYTYPSYFMGATDMTLMGAVDDHGGGSYAFGAFDTGYLYGKGKVTFPGEAEDGSDAKTYNAIGVATTYEKPMSPLYFDKMYVNGVSLSPMQPIAAGKELVANIYDRTDPDNPELVATLTAGKEDCIALSEEPKELEDEGSTITYMNYSIRFTQWEEGLMGDKVAAPIVLDFPYSIEILGFDQDGVDFGLSAANNGSEQYTPETRAIFENVEHEDGTIGRGYSHVYGIDLCNLISLNGFYDFIQVKQYAETEEGEPLDGFNVVEISEDGQTWANFLISDYPGAPVFTAAPWFDEASNENYYIDTEDNEWIVSTVTSKEEGLSWTTDTPYNFVGFTAEPLPADVKGRGAILYVEGRGVVAETPIFAYQGDLETAMNESGYVGVNSVLAPRTYSHANYNLAGQRVNAAQKGINIEDGKKVIR